MNLFKLFTECAAKIPIIGPHEGYEAELVLSGSKKLALVTEVIPPEGSSIAIEHADKIRRIEEDVQRLDQAVRDGKLSKATRETEFEDGMVWITHYYCQRGHEPKLRELESISSLTPTTETEAIFGAHMGYLPQDMRLFANGGYGSVPWPFSTLLERTEGFRRRCRAASEMGVDYFDLEGK